MGRLRRSTGLVAACAAIAVLTACSAGPQIERERRGNLDSAIKEFDPESISTLSSNVAGGSIEFQRGFTRLIVFNGADSWDVVVDRFSKLGYEGPVNPPGLSLARKDGIIVNGRRVDGPDDLPDL
ncbi:hypothetical protein, partial [Kitasatospora herbaricolor]|uniref:hypothetical protein n=1 Tax=Kitasatospora herbaricolor TaxID=68217 RepID=UPI0036D9AEDC